MAESVTPTGFVQRLRAIFPTEPAAEPKASEEQVRRGPRFGAVRGAPPRRGAWRGCAAARGGLSIFGIQTSDFGGGRSGARMHADAPTRRRAQVAEAPEQAPTPDAAAEVAAAPEAAAPKRAKAAKAKSPAAPKRAAAPRKGKAPKALAPKAVIAKAKATPKKKAKAPPASPVAKAKAPAAAKTGKPTAVWAANPLAFQTGASDRDARATAHRRGRV